jgi:hypothetical protein
LLREAIAGSREPDGPAGPRAVAVPLRHLPDELRTVGPDSAIHTWDLARAIGADEALHEDLVT